MAVQYNLFKFLQHCYHVATVIKDDCLISSSFKQPLPTELLGCKFRRWKSHGSGSELCHDSHTFGRNRNQKKGFLSVACGCATRQFAASSRTSFSSGLLPLPPSAPWKRKKRTPAHNASFTGTSFSGFEATVLCDTRYQTAEFQWTEPCARHTYCAHGGCHPDYSGVFTSSFSVRPELALYARHKTRPHVLRAAIG